MRVPKKGKSKEGKEMHYSVGALIERNGKYLLIDRNVAPFGFAGIAGHVDEGESPEEALIREVKEETGLNVENYELIFEEELDWNWCSRGIDVHYWYFYRCEVSGKIKREAKEAKSIDWYPKKEIKKLSLGKKLEAVWEYWFKKLKII